eukprot:403340517
MVQKLSSYISPLKSQSQLAKESKFAAQKTGGTFSPTFSQIYSNQSKENLTLLSDHNDQYHQENLGAYEYFNIINYESKQENAQTQKSNFDYGDVAKQIYKTGKEKKWTTQQIFKMLSDPAKFNQYLNKNIQNAQIPRNKTELKYQNKIIRSGNRDVVNRLVEDDRNRRHKFIQIEKQKQIILEKEHQESILSPLNVHNKQLNHYRSMDQFFQDQNHFEQKRKNKIQQMFIEEIEQQTKSKNLHISNQTIKLAQKVRQNSPDLMRGKPLHDRLFLESKVLSERKKSVEFARNQNLTLDCSLKRANQSSNLMEIVERVYNQKHQTKMLTTRTSKSSQRLNSTRDRSMRNTSLEQTSQNLISLKSQRLIEARIRKELNQVMEARNLQNDTRITIEQMREIMITLGFYNKQLRLPSELKLLNQLGGMLIPAEINPADELEYRIIMVNLGNAIKAILKIPFKQQKQATTNKIIERQSLAQSNTNSFQASSCLRQFTFNEQGIIYYSSLDCQWLADYFNTLAKNRSNYIVKQKQKFRMFKATSLESKSLTLQPEINQKSQQLGTNKLNQRLKNFDGQKSHHDLLINMGLESKCKMQFMREIKDREEQLAYNFKPTLVSKFELTQNQSQSRLEQELDNAESKKPWTNKWDELYLQSKERIKSQDKTIDEIQIEQEPHEYTFTPNLNLFKKARSTTKMCDNYYGMQKETKNIRSHKNLSNISQDTQTSIKYLNNDQNTSRQSLISNRGINQKSNQRQNIKHNQTPPNKLNSSKFIRGKTDVGLDYTHEEFEQPPLLFVDIHIGDGQKPRIVVYSHDDPERVAYKFAKQYHLDVEMRRKLVILLKNQMSKVLTQINEGLEDQEE